jgi:hypothetical protein
MNTNTGVVDSTDWVRPMSRVQSAEKQTISMAFPYTPLRYHINIFFQAKTTGRL